MKKNYLLIALLFAMSSMFAQSGNKFENANIFPINDIKNTDASVKADVVNEWNAHKAVNVAKMQLDSLMFAQFDQQTFAWENQQMQKYEYDAFGLNTVFTSAGWDDVNAEWVDKGYIEYYYGAGNMLDSMIQVHYASNGVTYSMKNEFTYNADDLVETIFESYNSSGMSWQLMGKSDFQYDTNGNDTTELGSYWDGGAQLWEVSSKEQRTYNADDKIVEELSSYWMGSGWNPTDKSEYTYNADGDLEETLESYYSGMWENSGKINYTYTAGMLASETYEYFNMSVWEPSYKTEYEYDSNDDLEYSYDYSWNSSNSTWEGNGRAVLDHDSNWGNDQLVLPNTFTEGEDAETAMLFSSQLIDYVYEVWFGITYVPMMDVDLYYSQIEFNENEELKTSTFNVFPNPVSDELTIDGDFENTAQVKIYNTMGSLVDSRNLNGNKLSVGDLPNGIYLLQIQTVDNVFTKQIIKQ